MYIYIYIYIYIRVLPRKIFKQGGLSERSELKNYRGRYGASEARPYKGGLGGIPPANFLILGRIL